MLESHWGRWPGLHMQDADTHHPRPPLAQCGMERHHVRPLTLRVAAGVRLLSVCVRVSVRERMCVCVCA